MNLKFLLACTWIGASFCTSCIKREALNAEADIEKCILPEEIRTDTEINYTLPFSETLGAYPLRVEVKNGTDLTALSPLFELTPGATIQPASGSTHDFTEPVFYTVTSEDGNWQRVYAVTIYNAVREDIPTVYEFEKARFVATNGTNGYYELYEEVENYPTLTWGSANQGYALAVPGAAADDYPTTLSPNGYTGNCVQLITRATGSLGSLVNMPIAAGNCFIGSFVLADALTDPLAATKFGTTFYYKPVRLTGYYKYKAGDQFYEDGEYTNKKDIFNLYGIFYEKTADVQTMDGYLADGYDHENMVAIALIDDPKETTEWTRFELEFDYARYGKTVDVDKLAKGNYGVGIVMASSKEGHLFKGAPGSTLLVDHMEIEYEDLLAEEDE